MTMVHLHLAGGKSSNIPPSGWSATLEALGHLVAEVTSLPVRREQRFVF